RFERVDGLRALVDGEDLTARVPELLDQRAAEPPETDDQNSPGSFHDSTITGRARGKRTGDLGASRVRPWKPRPSSPRSRRSTDEHALFGQANGGLGHLPRQGQRQSERTDAPDVHHDGDEQLSRDAQLRSDARREPSRGEGAERFEGEGERFVLVDEQEGEEAERD